MRLSHSPRPLVLLLLSLCFAVMLPAAASHAAARADTSLVHIGPADGGTDAFVAWPAGTEAAPAVVVAHEWWGLNGQIREVARRLARQGYVAIVPDLYHGKVAGDPERAHVLMRGVELDAAARELGMAVSWLRTQPRTAKAPIGTVGFCMGGVWAQAFAIRDPAVTATIVFYGNPIPEYATKAAARAPLQGHFGHTDDGIPAKDVEAFRVAVTRANPASEVYVYAGAGHAFMHEGRPSHHPDAARQAWARMLAFLQKHLRS